MSRYYFLIIFYFVNCNASNNVDADLFKAIKNNNRSAVQKALANGAFLNAIDAASKDTPLFYALKHLLNDVIYLDNDHEFIGIAGIVGLSLGFISWAMLTYYQKDDGCKFLAMFGSGIAGGLSAYAYHCYLKKAVLAQKEIITDLLRHPSLDLNSRHEKMKKTVQEFVESILKPKLYGYYYESFTQPSLFGAVEIGPRTYKDDAYVVNFDDEDCIFRARTHTQYIKPLFEKIKDQMIS